jgi:heme-degrading monooxygenase HmoA
MITQTNLARRRASGVHLVRTPGSVSACQIVLIFLSFLVHAQCYASAAESTASPAMKRLFQAFVGRWRVEETFAQSEFFPKGGSRTGRAHFTIGTSGTSLIEDYHSNGSAGKLDFLMVVWWDSEIQRYRVFTCSNDPENAGKLRGTAHWEGGTFVNDYEVVVNGKPKKSQDRFSELTPQSFTLVAGITTGKRFEHLITTRYKRLTFQII